MGLDLSYIELFSCISDGVFWACLGLVVASAGFRRQRSESWLGLMQDNISISTKELFFIGNDFRCQVLLDQYFVCRCHLTPVHMYIHTCMPVGDWWGQRMMNMIEVKCNIILPSSLSISQRALVAAHENIAGFPGVSFSFSSPTLRLVGVSLRL